MLTFTKKKNPVFNFQVSPRSHLKHTITTAHNTSAAVLTRPGNDPGDLRHCVQTVCGDHPDSSPVVNSRYFAGGWGGANKLDPEIHLHLVLLRMVLYLHHP
jgi:hypothetical protein